MARPLPIPHRRSSRLLHLVRLAGGITAGVLGEGARQLAVGNRPGLGELLLTPGNARRLAERLSEMRGAAMKVGQLLSMEAGDYLPPELTAVLTRLREDAHPMPLGQVAGVLTRAWGADWQRGFSRFSFTPMAAASIGQVHEATTGDGRHLAIKVQYPGVRDSIDSDVNNVAALLKLFRLVPEQLDLSTLLDEARQQLHREADYLAEAASIAEYADRLGDTRDFTLPSVDASLTTAEVLAMSYVDGDPIETLNDAPSQIRNRVATRLMDLALREVLDWGLVQTDANFANYRYQAEQDRIGLLDFGATRHYAPDCVARFRALVSAAVRDDHDAIETHAIELGYLRPDEDTAYRSAMCGMISTVAEPARIRGPFSFAASDLARRVGDQATELRLRQRYWHLPPPELLFLHRKLGGTYLLCARLRARIDVGALMEPYLE